MADSWSRRNSASSSNTRMSSSSSNEGIGCGYCLRNGFDGYEAYQHTKQNCPRLASLQPCEYCGASGYNNHTKSHCPRKPRVELPSANYGYYSASPEGQSSFSGYMQSSSFYSIREKCVFCNANDYPCVGHTNHNCPRLLQLNPCQYCGASGINNHTKRHCPQRPRIDLQLKSQFK
ncbi:CBR-NOS-2 protein [Ditylenchus destructor]|uniref:CBR-NOS-2 protein n=1 Tax=Ditylenchus destructor TaxID=166010 RepID=A0AAD4R3P5_9BILA|nr:CBR-NOS-2 protein [Ditylenchus destructor]